METRNGFRIVPDRVSASWPADRLLAAAEERQPAMALDDALEVIGTRYAGLTADVVARQLEYPQRRRGDEALEDEREGVR